MKKLILLVFGASLFFAVHAQDHLPEEYRDEVQHFVDCIKKKDISALSTLVRFPLKRDYPIPAIKDSTEFKLRFSEVFDDSLIAVISASDVMNDWSEVGWRGIMLGNGSVWLDTDGSLIAVNYQSDIEAAKQKELIEKDRNSLYPALQELESPAVVLETKKFRVRIDEMADGTYRYASWNINKQMSEEPDIILKNGKVHFLGSGGNHEYEFINKEFRYVCAINVLGSDETPPARLFVLKHDKPILQQDAVIVLP